MVMNNLSIEVPPGNTFDLRRTCGEPVGVVVTPGGMNQFAAAWAETAWYIDQGTGNDANSGTSAAAPLRTARELQNRLGPWAIWDHDVTIHIGSTGCGDTLVIHGQRWSLGPIVDLQGTLTTVATFVLTTYTATNHNAGGTPNGPEITSTTVPTWTVGTRIRQTTGANAGAIAFVLADLGGGIALTSMWSRIGSTGQVVDSKVPEVGETFVIERLSRVAALDVDLAGPWPGNNSSDINMDRSFGMRDVDVATSTRLRVQGSSAESILCYGNILDGLLEIGGPTNIAKWQVVSCLCRVWNPTGVLFQYCGIMSTTCPTWSATRVECGSNVHYGHSVLVGTKLYCQQGNFSISDCFFHEFANPAILGNSQGNVDLSGAGISGRSTVAGSYGIQAKNGSQWFIESGMVLNLEGASGQVLLSDAPATPLTWTQFAYYGNDNAHSGAGNLVAGTLTVTVPYWADATVRPVVCYNSLSGTPGILTVDAVSNTQFKIDSNVPTDTGRVYWALAAEGRCISVVKS